MKPLTDYLVVRFPDGTGLRQGLAPTRPCWAIRLWAQWFERQQRLDGTWYIEPASSEREYAT